MNHQPGKLDVAQPVANQNGDEGGGNADQVLPAPGGGDRVMDDGNEEIADKNKQIVS